MSVDISRLAAHLAPQQQEAIRKEYRKRAWHDTTAFLLCFFGGIFGAHRFYLHQYALGLLHLILPIAALVVLVGGIATGMGPAIIAIIVVILLLIALVWSLIDLFRIDDEVYAHNLKLAERLIAQAMLSDHSVERSATARVEELRHEAATASAAAGAAAAGRAVETNIEYHATTVTDISTPAPEQERLDAHQQPQSWTQTEQVPIGGYGPPVQETVTRSHKETPQSVTDSVETVHTFEPQVPAGASPDDTQPAAPAPVDLDPTTAPAGAFAAPEPIASDAPTWPEHPPLEYEVPLAGAAAGLTAAAAAAGMAHEHAEAPTEQAGSAIDYTDLGVGDDVQPGPVADVAEARSAPQRVTLPPEPSATYDPYATASAPPAPAPAPAAASPADDGTLLLVPDDTAAETRAADPVPATPSPWDAPTQRYPASADEAQTAAAEPPLWPVPEPASGPQPLAAPQPAAHDEPPTMPYNALAAGATGAALAGGAAAYEAAHHAPAEDATAQAQPAPQPQAQPAPQPHRQLRRVRVTRQVVEDGKVVDETAAEELIPADADPEPVRARLQERLKIQAEARERELRGQS